MIDVLAFVTFFHFHIRIVFGSQKVHLMGDDLKSVSILEIFFRSPVASNHVSVVPGAVLCASLFMEV